MSQSSPFRVNFLSKNVHSHWRLLWKVTRGASAGVNLIHPGLALGVGTEAALTGKIAKLNYKRKRKRRKGPHFMIKKTFQLFQCGKKKNTEIVI